MQAHSKHYTPAPDGTPAVGAIRYIICADDRCIAVYRVRYMQTLVIDWEDGSVEVTQDYEPAPDAEHPDIYTPGVEDKYLMHGIYVLDDGEGADTDD